MSSSRNTRALVTLMGIVVAGAAAPAEESVGTAFTYQGQLKHFGAPFNGTADFQFTLFDDVTDGAAVGETVEVTTVPINNGLFTADMDFGATVFDGSARWVEVAIRIPAWDGEGGEPAFTTLDPRQAIKATPYALQTRGIVVSQTGNVGVGTISPDARLNIDGGTDASPAGGGFLILGDTTGTNIGMDSNEIMARDNGTTATLLINREGGDVAISNIGNGSLGVGTSVPEARVHIKGGTDSEPVSGGFLILGNTTGANISMDNNEIMARNNGSTSTLYLNADGGDVVVGGDLDIGIEIVTNSGPCETNSSIFVDCPPGKTVIGGGCSRICTRQLYSSHPTGLTGWKCAWDGCGQGFCEAEHVQVYAICAGVK